MMKLYMESLQKRYIENGDIVSLDAGLIYKGYHSDAARTHGVGEISPEAQRIIDVTKQSFLKVLNLQNLAII